MPTPGDYERSYSHFISVLESIKIMADYGSTHQAYTPLQSVFQVFRRRVPNQVALKFADQLSPLLRALFVKDWDLSEPKRSFESFEQMNAEVKELRHEHNFATSDSIEIVTEAVRRSMTARHWEQMMATLEGEAREFWKKSRVQLTSESKL